MKSKMKVEAQLPQSVFTTIEDDEELAGYNCPICGYPIVIELGLELCYCCGWCAEDEKEGYYDE